MAINYWGKLAEEFGNFYKALRTALNNPGDLPLAAQNNDAIASSMAIWEAIGDLDLTPFRSAIPLTVTENSLVGMTASNTFNSYPIDLPLGFPRLDANNKIPTTFLPPTTGGLTYLGSWNAATNTPTLASNGLYNGASTTNGSFLICATGGTLFAIDGESSFNPGDQLISDGTKWIRIPDNNSVLSVNGLTGEIVLTPGIIGAQPLGNQLTAIQALAWPSFPTPGLLGYNGTTWNYFQFGGASGVATLNANSKLVQMPTAADVGADSTGTALGFMQTHNAQFNHASYATQQALTTAITNHETTWNHSFFITQQEADILYLSKDDFSTAASVVELSAQTIGVTTVTIGSYALSVNQSITISGHVVGKGSAGANIGKVMFFFFYVSAINDNAEIRIISSPGFESEIVTRGDASAGWTAIAEINQGTDRLEIRVTGDSASTVDWKTAFLVTKF